MIDERSGRVQLTVDDVTSALLVLGVIRKQAEQAKESKHSSMASSTVLEFGFLP